MNTLAMSTFYSKYANWFIRIIALGIAIFLWYYVYYNLNRSEQNVILEIKFRSIPSNLHTKFNFNNQRTVVKIQGKKKDVNEFISNTSYIKCFVDLSGARAGKARYKIRLEQSREIKDLLTNINITFSKSFVDIAFDSFVKKKVLIVGKVLGLSKKDISLLRVRYIPKSILVEGPKRILSSISNIRAEDYRIGKDQRYFDITDRIKLKKLPRYIRNISKVQSVNIHIATKSKVKESTIKDVQIIIMENIFSGLKIKQGKLMLSYITYKGPASLIDTLNKDEVKAYINISPFSKPGRYTISVIPQAKQGLSIVDYAPKELKVSLVGKKLRG